MIVALFALALAGSASAAGVTIVMPEPLVAPPVAEGKVFQPVSMTRVAANIAPGVVWLEETSSPYFMLPCMPIGDVSRWVEADNKVTSLDSLDRVFRTTMTQAGLRAGGDPNNLFEEQQSADLQVGALVTALQVKTCRYILPVRETLQGSATMDVTWQVYSVSQGRVIARIPTRGGFVLTPTSDKDIGLLVRGVFADNVRRLAASEEFRRLVSADAAPVAPPPKGPLTFNPARKSVGISAAAGSVVSIFAGDALGSGVVISTDGDILTNHHVAGDSGRVRVRWADGSESVGEVIRADRRRDVALIRTKPKAAPLLIRRTPIAVGATVFAIGTPLEKELFGTLTRGVVSATRMREGLPYIQSDVSINHGNSGGPLLDETGSVVGLTVSGIAPGGAPVGLNFFIPISDALRALDLRPVA